MEFEREHKEELMQHWESTKHQKKDGGRSNKQRISEIEAMLWEQARVIVSLRAYRYTPLLTPIPPLVLHAPRKPLQPISGFNQRKSLMEDMDARKGRDDQSIGAISYRIVSYLRYQCAALASSKQDHKPTEYVTELDSHADSPTVV